jgi:hypothetical protein
MNKAMLQAHMDAKVLGERILKLLNQRKLKEALALKPRWQAAKQKYDAISALQLDIEAWKKRYPIRPHPIRRESSNTMLRSVFDTLDPKRQMHFIDIGGRVVDDPPNGKLTH